MHIGNKPFGISRSVRPEGKYFNNTNRKCTKWSKHKSLYCPIRTNFTIQQTLKHIFTLAVHALLKTVKLLHWEGMQLQPHPIPSQTSCSTCPPTESFDLVVQISDFLTLAEVCLDPCTFAQCPWLGPDRMPQIPGAWVYVWSKACQQRTHEQRSSCCIKLLVMSL